MSEPGSLTEADIDARLRLEAARQRAGRDRCPHPDVLVARRSELLEPTMREALSRHLRACEACARLSVDLDALESERPDAAAEARILARVRKAAPARRWRWALPAAAAILVTCAAGATWWMRSPSTALTPAATMSPPPVSGAQASPSQDDVAPRIVARWTIEAAPVRIPISSVGASRSGDATANTGVALMDALAPYQAGLYAEAIPRLEAVVRAGPDSADAEFYLGVARLLADRPADALAPLERAAALANLRGAAVPPPHARRRADIDWYRATAEQRTGRVDAARARLDALCAVPGDYRARACAAAQALR